MSETAKPHQHDHSGLKLSVFFSTLCLIHCLTFPIIIAVLTLFNMTFQPPEWIEFSLLGATLGLGLYSMRHGFNLHHHAFYPLVLFSIGMIGAFAVHLFWHNHSHEFSWVRTSLEIFFALLIAVSQFINYRLSRTMACTTQH